MFGALLGRVPDAFSLMADFHVFYAGIVVLFVCVWPVGAIWRSGAAG